MRTAIHGQRIHGRVAVFRAERDFCTIAPGTIWWRSNPEVFSVPIPGLLKFLDDEQAGMPNFPIAGGSDVDGDNPFSILTGHISQKPPSGAVSLVCGSISDSP